jgi:hypothetical protein
METKTELLLPVIDASQEDWEERSHWEEQKWRPVDSMA